MLQVVLARQLANQPPSQLPLQRLTSEQMQQLQLQVQQDRQRQVTQHFPHMEQFQKLSTQPSAELSSAATSFLGMVIIVRFWLS